MSTETPSRRRLARFGPFTWLALVLSAGAMAGTLYLSIGMGLKACPLCIYERTFVFGVLGVLLVGLGCDARPGLLSMLALPMAAGALTVSLFHVYLELNGTLECPRGILGVGSAPQQGFAVIVVLFLMLLLDASGVGAGGQGLRLPLPVGSVVLGALLGVACIKSAPPAAPAPPGGWPLDLQQDGCRLPAKQGS
jgi:hypothetical protein